MGGSCVPGVGSGEWGVGGLFDSPPPTPDSLLEYLRRLVERRGGGFHVRVDDGSDAVDPLVPPLRARGGEDDRAAEQPVGLLAGRDGHPLLGGELPEVGDRAGGWGGVRGQR